MMRVGPWLRRTALAFVVVGCAMRLAAPFFMDIAGDGSNYAMMGRSLAGHGNFYSEWGQWFGRGGAGYTHHYSPLYPAYLAGWYSAVGYSLYATKAAGALMALGCVAACWWFTRDLFGKGAALLVAGLLALEPDLVLSAGNGFTESLVTLCYAATLWCIMRSLKDPRFMLGAGACAALGYLTRGGMDVFFVLAGAGGLWWRVAHDGWRKCFDKWYAAGAAVFAAVAASWAMRNVWHFGFGGWRTSAYVAYAQEAAMHDPWRVLAVFAVKLAFFVSFMAVYAVPLWRETRAGLATWRSREGSLLMLAAFLVLFIGAAMSAVFWSVEKTPLLWRDNKRYAVAAFVPLLWLALGLGRRAPHFLARYAGLGVFLALVSALMFMVPQVSTTVRAGAELDGLVWPGATIGIVGPQDPYAWYAYMGHTDVLVKQCWWVGHSCEGWEPDFVLARVPVVLDNYVEVRHVVVQRFFGVGGATEAFLYEKLTG